MYLQLETPIDNKGNSILLKLLQFLSEIYF